MKALDLETRAIEQRRAPDGVWEYTISVRTPSDEETGLLGVQIRIETTDSYVADSFRHANDLVAVFMAREEASIKGLI